MKSRVNKKTFLLINHLDPHVSDATLCKHNTLLIIP
jgi:hypothetical protein